MIFPDPPLDPPVGYTLEQALIDVGREVPHPVDCPNCHAPSQAFAIVPVDDIPDDAIPGIWACSTCRQDHFRDTAPPRSLTIADIRGERDRRLALCDWTQLIDVPEETQLAWQLYRQELRDFPDTVIDPNDVEWPVAPG